MRRLLTTVLVVAALAAAAVASAGAGDDGSAKRYTVELDNAFGLVEGADLKVAGVRAGKITKMRLDRRTKRALIDFEVTKTGFGSLRADVFCETRPQSLIGEYFLDCLPGTSRRELRPGSVIPVTRTASTVPVDLINNIMRRPYRERLRIILSQLGAGVGARGEDLNEAIRRASPALRETDRVLRILARQNRILADLAVDADRVIGDLSDNRTDVARWARETRETAAASAERRQAIAAGLRRLPQFLRELRPTMAELGRVSDAQAPALADLEASAAQLERLFENLGPFSESSRVNFRSLGEAARKGRPAVAAARPVVAELDRFGKKTPELANNLAIVLDHLDDRRFAVEKDPRSPGGQGYTGFEALLQYIYDQVLSTNIYDRHGYLLKVNLFESECASYQTPESIKEHLAEDPKFLDHCLADLGPNHQGVTVPDPTKPPEHATDRERRRRASLRGDNDRAAARGERREGGDRRDAARPAPSPSIDLGKTLEKLLDGALPKLKAPSAPAAPDVRLRDDAARDALLDFLFGS